MTITEIGLMGVKPGHNVMDESTAEGQILADAWKAVAAAPTGPRQVYFGLEVEDPLMIWAFFDWESLESHEDFAKSFGGEAVKDLPLVLSHGVFTKHVSLSPFPPVVLRSPVTGVMIAYFPSDISPARKEESARTIKQPIEKSLENFSDSQGLSSGWGVENDFPVRGGVEGQTGSIFMTLIGWPSVEAAMRFQDSNLVRDSLKAIRAIEGILKFDAFHLSCRTLGRDID